MENAIWIDLGDVGHRAEILKTMFQVDFIVELPQQFDDNVSQKWVVFIDYTLGGSGLFGTKVFTNAFATELDFYKVLSEKLIKNYVTVDKSLDFSEDF